MAKGGRYLDKSKNRKKGRGWKVALIILLILLLLIGGVVTIVFVYLGKINPAPVRPKDVSDEEWAYWETWSPQRNDEDDGFVEELPEEMTEEMPEDDTAEATAEAEDTAEPDGEPTGETGETAEPTE